MYDEFRNSFLDMQFKLLAPFEPAGDQPEAIEQLVAGLREGRREQVLMGVTGSGKPFLLPMAGQDEVAGEVVRQIPVQ